MRLATITNWAYGVTVVLTFASGATMLTASAMQESERTAVAQRYALDRATSLIEQDGLSLSDLARKYVVNGNTSDLVIYQRARRDLASVEARVRHVRDAGATDDEVRALRDGLNWIDALQAQQVQAVGAAQAGDRASAIDVLFSAEYERELDRSRAAIERFQYRLDQRTSDDLLEAERAARLWRRASEVMLAITGLLFLGVLFFIYRRRVLHPVVRLSDVVGRLAKQDFAVEPPHYERIDEIGDMADALRVFRENGIERQRLEQERDADRRVRDLLSRMTQRMQGCDTIADLLVVIERFVPHLALDMKGGLYLHDPARNVMRLGCSWTGTLASSTDFAPTACWGLRRNAPHCASGERFDVPCAHLTEAVDSQCLPLNGQNGLLGLLYLERGESDVASPLGEHYLQMLAENVTLALDNLRLREALHGMAMADPLTTLPNRRQLDQVVTRELALAEEHNEPVCCAMIDIDHFKRFNDDHGHDAGDAVLRSVGVVLAGMVRDDHLVFRYGGEEFLVLLKGMTIDTAERRAEEIRTRMAALTVTHEGRSLGPITVSIGLAAAPLHTHWSKLIQTADAALLRAKQAGRNRVLVASVRGDQRAA
ncbi:diguanylate cyclase [Sphingomonas sp. Mn802worker]|uniref:diguanylate cyclase n=1 Tax=Sphingomonas sp. Mn802worker TaxID=629773 RepID=UPI000363B6F5|nr:diguanylate cyclase [Sphingomonas sp. Mn802worker]